MDLSYSWRKEPYPARCYVPLEDYIATTAISADEANTVLSQLQTSMEDGFAGPAMNCEDQEEMEKCKANLHIPFCIFHFVSGMTHFRTKSGEAIVSEDQIIAWQVRNCLDFLTGAVQDRVLNERGTLKCAPVGLGPRLKEVAVWGIDYYTRRMLEMILVDTLGRGEDESETLEIAQGFIESTLLPCINAQPAAVAHDMDSALEYIITVSPFEPHAHGTNVRVYVCVQNAIFTSNQKRYAGILRSAKRLFGSELFKIHPKGTGVICTDPEGIAPHVVISEYLGELYPPYRWCEKLAVLEKTQKLFGLKPTLPDFYNILLERHQKNPDGYGAFCHIAILFMFSLPSQHSDNCDVFDV